MLAQANNGADVPDSPSPRTTPLVPPQRPLIESLPRYEAFPKKIIPRAMLHKGRPLAHRKTMVPTNNPMMTRVEGVKVTESMTNEVRPRFKNLHVNGTI